MSIVSDSDSSVDEIPSLDSGQALLTHSLQLRVTDPNDIGLHDGHQLAYTAPVTCLVLVHRRDGRETLW